MSGVAHEKPLSVNFNEYNVVLLELVISQMFVGYSRFNQSMVIFMIRFILKFIVMVHNCGVLRDRYQVRSQACLSGVADFH